MVVLKINKYNARTAMEEYWYWFYIIRDKIDEKLPWDMHPNEVRAATLYRRKLMRKMQEALDSEELEV